MLHELEWHSNIQTSSDLAIPHCVFVLDPLALSFASKPPPARPTLGA